MTSCFLAYFAIFNGETPLVSFYVKLLEGLSKTKVSIFFFPSILFPHIFYFIFLYHKLYPLFLSLNPKNK